MEKFENKEGFGVVKLGSEDVVRHKLINTIEQVFGEIVEELSVKSNVKNKKEVVNQISLPTLLLEEKKDNIQ
jgi:phosphate starvation-inducible protein PhoH